MQKENDLPEACAETCVNRHVLAVAPNLQWRCLHVFPCETVSFRFLLLENTGGTLRDRYLGSWNPCAGLPQSWSITGLSGWPFCGRQSRWCPGSCRWQERLYQASGSDVWR